MGIGKTPQAVVACDIAGARNILVVCPAIMREQWSREFARFSSVRRRVQQLASLAERAKPESEVVICSFDYTRAPAAHATLCARRWDALIVDEGHALKDPTAAQTIAVYGGVGDGAGALAGSADRLWVLTGTPAPNHIGELYPHLRASGRYTGGLYDFLNAYATWHATPYGYKVTANKNVAGARQLLAPVILRRTKAEVKLQLPPLVVGELVVEPQELDQQFPVIDELRQLEPQWAGKVLDAIIADDWTFQDEEALATVRRLIGLAKVPAVVQYARQLLDSNPREKLVIFCLHRQVLKYLAEFLRKDGAKIIYGGSNETRKQNYIDAFQTDDRARVLLCQIKAAGTGITLTAASHLLLAEPSWTPADNDQAMMRVHRIGQDRTTFVNYVSLAGSFDEVVNATLRRKTAMIAEILS